MEEKRIRYSGEFKAKVALEALKGPKTDNELASQYQVHSTQISQWKQQVQGGARQLFSTAPCRGDQALEAVQADLHKEVVRLKMELDWIRKTPELSCGQTAVDCAKTSATQILTFEGQNFLLLY